MLTKEKMDLDAYRVVATKEGVLEVYGEWDREREEYPLVAAFRSGIWLYVTKIERS